ncbi:MAG: MCE family protein, partial [Actinomycetes bacterium]
GGLVFLLVLAGLIGLSVATYTKAFSDTVTVTLRADRIGNQLSTGGDVKVRGLIIGEVRSVRATDDGAELELHLQPEQAATVPADATAMILPKTLFGEKFVSIVYDEPASGGPQSLADGGVIEQDRSATAREFSQALDNLLPVLQTLEPEQLSVTLNAVSSALRDRGDQIGGNLVLVRQYLAEFNPELPRLAENVAGTADFADNLDAAAPDLLSLLEDFSAINRNLVRDEQAIEQVLVQTTGLAGTAESFVAENEQRFITLARVSQPNLRLYEKYAPMYPCLAYSLVDDHRAIADSFGTLQPGLHITLEFTRNNGGYVPGDEPEYLDRSGPTCRSLGAGPRERPIPEYQDAEDGYRDGQEVNPATGERSGEPPDGPSGPYTYPDQRRKAPQDSGAGTTSASGLPLSAATYDRAAVGAVVAPALGVAPSEVPDVAVLLFAPVARGTVVQVA